MLNFKNIKHFLAILGSTLLASWLLYAFLGQIIGQQFNHSWLYGGNYGESSGKIVIVKVDNKTLDALQNTDLRVLNFTKSKFSELIEKLEKYKAKAIGVDIVFANKSSDISVLVTTLKKYNNIVIGAKIGLEGKERTLPLPDFQHTTWGSVDTAYSSDSNILSRYSPFALYNDKPIEALSVATYRKYIEDTNGPIGVVKDGHYALTPLRSMPLDSSGNMLIRFFNPPEQYPSISMIDILTADTPEKEAELEKKLSGKIVLIGEYGTLIHDAHFSPVDTRSKMPGVEFHANMIDTLLQNKTLVPQDSATVWILTIFLASLLILSFYFAGTGVAVIMLIVETFALVIIGRYLIVNLEEGIVINLFFYLLTSLVAFIGTYLYKYLIVDRNRRQIEGAFSRYIAPDVVAEIARDPENLKLGGERRRIAIFFSDIANFTTISESLGTEKIFALLSEYLSEMTDILVENRGTLDKYIGDAVMGFFGAPHTVDRPSFLACKTALEQQKHLRRMNEKWKHNGYPELVVRIGINTGEVMVGNIGSKERFNYTAIGDDVNLASRLEGVNKEYGTLICVSESVYEETKEDFLYRELDKIRVKGKKEGVMIYELIGDKNEDGKDEKYTQYEKGLSLYYEGNYEEALQIFKHNSSDFTSEILATRCKKIISGEVVVKDGVYEMKGK